MDYNTSDRYIMIISEYWRVIKKYRFMIGTIVGFASVCAVILSLLLPPTWMAGAVIVPVSSRGAGGTLAALASQFGGLASMAGVGLPQAADDSSKFLAILKSRTLAEKVIFRENLMPILFPGKWDAEMHRWKSDDPKKQPKLLKGVGILCTKKMKFFNDKKLKTIVISGVFSSPEIAARVVNAYVAELQEFITANSFTVAKRNRIFIEGQLEENKRELLEAGKDINEYYKNNRISNAEALVDVDVDIGNDTVAKNEPSANQIGQETQEPLIASLSPNLSNLLSQKDDIKKKIAEANIVKNIPQQVYLTYLMLRRELLVKVNSLLTTQYEVAKIEEMKDELSFQIIDDAVPPVLRYSPKRAKICIITFVAALFSAVSIAMFRENVARMRTAGILVSKSLVGGRNSGLGTR